MSELYDILGVDKDASQEEIKQAFKRKAGQCHPDRHNNDPESTKAFQQIQRAYAVLKDESKRKRYDETGSEDSNAPSLDENANGVIAKIYLDIASRNGFTPRNYILETTKAIQNALRECLVEKKKLEQETERLEYLIDNTAADEVLIAMLTEHLRELNFKRGHAQEGYTVLTRALELLDTYRYTGTVPQTNGPQPWANADPWIS